VAKRLRSAPTDSLTLYPRQHANPIRRSDTVSYPEPNDFNALRHLCLCKIVSEDGQVGWGESITQFAEASHATKAIIEGWHPI